LNAGQPYRLITAIHFGTQKVFVRHVHMGKMTEANGRKHEPFAKKSHGDKSRVTGPVSAHNMQACRALNVYHTCARVVGFPIRWELARRDRTRPAGFLVFLLAFFVFMPIGPP
jgi:hypothetical protein